MASWARPKRWVGIALALVWIWSERPAVAYEFEIHARTIGQAYQLRSFRFVGGDLELSRRRFTQTLALSIWDIGEASPPFYLYRPRPRRIGPKISFHSYLRLDHDFGDWTTGEVIVGSRRVDALDLIPELQPSSLQMDVLYAYFAAEGLIDRRVDLYLGRQLSMDTLDWFAMDGLTTRLSPRALPLSVELFGGLQVRQSSPLGYAELEPDGTSGARCQEYAEGATPGSGAWRPIDLGRPEDDSPFTSDFEVCPQRQELMPTFGMAVALRGLRRTVARLAYRRAISPTVGLLAEPDRLDFEDVGFYPNEAGQAPDWGTNQERVSLSGRTSRQWGHGRGEVTGFAAARYSILHGLIDEALVGTRLGYKAHAIEPEIYYSFPTFDGDSIFNVFSIQPYVDSRLTYELGPRKTPWRAYVRGWLRRYRIEDSGRAMPGADVATGALSGGGQVGGRWLHSRRRLARVDLFHEGGYGGRRTGGYLYGLWRIDPTWTVSLRGTLVDWQSDVRPDDGGVTLGAQAGATVRIFDDIALSLVGEELTRFGGQAQLALYAMLDMAFRPEL